MAILQEQKSKWFRNKKRLILTGIALLFTFYAASAFVMGIIRSRFTIPEPTLLLVDRHYQFVAELEKTDSEFGYWPLPDTIPHLIKILTISAEDRRFYSHSGIDIVGITRALWSNYITRKSYSGASTIAMQCARLQNPGKRTWHKKISESVSALLFTVSYGRERVLRQYLTTAPYGNRICGVNYAARRYFQKPVQDLSYAEMALLAAIPRAPGRFNIFTVSGFNKAKNRAGFILDRAAEYNWIDSITYETACHELSHIPIPQKEYRSNSSLHAILAIEKYLNDNPVSPIDPYNPTIRLSMDLQLQEKIQQVVFSQMKNLRAFDCDNCAVLILDKSSGKVLSYIGNEYYFDSTAAGNIDFVQVPRSTGSLLKPFIYACGMEFNGYNESTLLTDVGLHFGDGKNPYITRNYDNEFIGPVLYRTALANSRNIPAVQVLRDVGIHRVHDILYNLGIVSGTATADYYGLGMALGNVYTDLYHLCQGYLSLANHGRKCSINFLFNDSLHDSYNIFSSDIAEHIQYMLSDPQARLPSFPRNGFLEYRYPVAIKTGTSRGFRDAWTIGWSDTYMVGVWLGKHNNTPTKKLSGYGAAAPFVKAIFSELHPDRDDGLSNVSFNPPGGYKPYMISTLSGALASPNFPYATRGWFKPGTSPEMNDLLPYKIMPVDTRNGLLASPLCRKTFVKYKRFISLPPLFKDWALREGLPVAPTSYSQLCGTWTEPVNYKLTITNPLPDAQLYVDPEMPPGHSSILLNCLVKPEVESVIWIVDGVEAGVSKYPYRHKWIIEPGIHTFQVQIPYTEFKSSIVKVKVM